MGRIVPTPGENQWAISFVTGGRSRKVLEIGRCGRVAAVFQHDPTGRLCCAERHREPAM